jgi:alpha-glucoside transport system permease protein
MFKSVKTQERVGSILINGSLALLCILWILPVLGLLVSSFRDRFDIATSGWWTIFPHREWVKTAELDPKTLGVDPNGTMTIEGVTGTFEEFRAGIQGNGVRVQWVGNKRLGKVEVQKMEWTTRTKLTTENYANVLTGKRYTFSDENGNKKEVQGDNLGGAFLNSIGVTIPATVIPILIAAFAAYGFAWMQFPGRRLFFITLIALLVVPLQISLVPILRDYTRLGLNGTYLAIWLAHTGFGLPLATYLLYNYVSQLPRDILESAFIDGASHFTVFTRLILPLSFPALASFAIFQFLWVWNDYLVALIFIGDNPALKLLTMRLVDVVGSRGNDWHLLTAAAFVTMILPMTVFLSMQRYFVRGLLAGSVKG